MPNPSLGCQTCKSRRIKCDEAKPRCLRCVKSNRTCLERVAAKQTSFLVHSENAYASGRVKRPRGPRSSLSQFRPSPDLPSLAVAYFLNWYLEQLTELPTVSSCMSECLIDWKSSPKKSSMSSLAVSALSLAIFSRTKRHPGSAREAAMTYGRLLMVVNECMSHASIDSWDVAFLDECLLVVVLMAWYETSMHQPRYLVPNGPRSMHSWSHYDGAIAILKVWSLRGDAPSSIVKQCRRGMIRLALLRNHPLPEWIVDGGRFGERGLSRGFDDILVRAVNLRQILRNFSLHKKMHGGSSEKLRSLAEDLDRDCRKWAFQVPSNWSFRSLTIPSTTSPTRQDFYSTTVYSFKNRGYAAVWVQYLATRMLIVSICLQLVETAGSSEWPGSADNQRRHECMLQLQDLANSLAATVPFSLGKVKMAVAVEAWVPSLEQDHPLITINTKEEVTPASALPIAWPLTAASGLHGVESTTRLWFLSQLERLGRVLGDGALECARTDEWSHGPTSTMMAGRQDDAE